MRAIYFLYLYLASPFPQLLSLVKKWFILTSKQHQKQGNFGAFFYFWHGLLEFFLFWWKLTKFYQFLSIWFWNHHLFVYVQKFFDFWCTLVFYFSVLCGLLCFFDSWQNFLVCVCGKRCFCFNSFFACVLAPFSFWSVKCEVLCFCSFHFHCFLPGFLVWVFCVCVCDFFICTLRSFFIHFFIGWYFFRCEYGIKTIKISSIKNVWPCFQR